MYKTEQITNNSYEDIQYLFRMSFGSKHSIESIKLKYDTSSFGLKNIGILAKDNNNKPAAYYGVFPIILNYNSKDYLIAQSGDTMTNPSHQKKGLFIKLAKQTYKLCNKKGVNLIYGFPNKNSYPGFKRKLDWMFYGFMQKFTFHVKTIPFCELSSKISIIQPFYNKFVKTRIEKFKIDLSQINFDSFNFSKVKGNIKKDLTFFEYKMKKNSVYLISIDGFNVLIRAQTHLYIGEVNKFKKSQINAFIKSMKRLAKIIYCNKIIITLSKNHWLYDFLKEKFNSTDSYPIGFYAANSTIEPKEIHFSFADFDSF